MSNKNNASKNWADVERKALFDFNGQKPRSHFQVEQNSQKTQRNLPSPNTGYATARNW